MTERLLQFIWQFRYFNYHELRLETGESLYILSPGQINAHQGPDFLWATIRIGNTVWVGNIELHLLASGWDRHAHGKDKHYNNVILHVVWENDLSVGGEDNLSVLEWKDLAAVSGVMNGMGETRIFRDIPILVLQHRVPKLLLGKYEEWMMSRSFIACEAQLSQMGQARLSQMGQAPLSQLAETRLFRGDGAVWSGWKQKLLEQRFRRKALMIRDLLRSNNQHWEETTWWLLARIFGIPVNAGAFEAIARSLPLRIWARHRENPGELEALLLGQAGFLKEGFYESYPVEWQRIFRHLQIKYHLQPIHEPILTFRMRPGNFPAIRLVQLAELIRLRASWFAGIREAGSLRELRRMLEAEDPLPGNARKKMGQQIKDSILINGFLPLIYAYGLLRKEAGCQERALYWLQEIRAEKNAVIAGWNRLGIRSRNAADSQALLELKNGYCGPKKCLECAIGQMLLGAKAA